jgi:hypothetical protein
MPRALPCCCPNYISARTSEGGSIRANIQFSNVYCQLNYFALPCVMSCYVGDVMLLLCFVLLLPCTESETYHICHVALVFCLAPIILC